MRVLKLINLTPHTIDLLSGTRMSIPSSGTTWADEDEKCVEVVEIGNGAASESALATVRGSLPLVRRFTVEITGLPQPQDGVLFIVPAVVAKAAWKQGRRDVAFPYDVVRDRDGFVVGCKSLCVGEGEREGG